MAWGIRALLAVVGLVLVWFLWQWVRLEKRRPESPPGTSIGTLWDLAIGFVTNFFDALGIGNFAPTTAAFKLLRRMPDEEIPGTLNAGHTLPILVEASIFIAAVAVDFTTLVAMIIASVIGAWFGAGIVARLSRRAVQIGMGIALLGAAVLFLAANLHWMPGGGEALGLSGGPLLLAICVNCVLGALMTLGIGLYAPCLMLVSLLGMSPLAAFPIMMGSCALLMPVAGVRFIEAGRYNLRASVALSVAGVPGVLIAAYIVKSLPLLWLRWLVVVVVTYAAATMLSSSRRLESPVLLAEDRESSPLRR
jgi:uncharacterized membrane protein YfcA